VSDTYLGVVQAFDIKSGKFQGIVGQSDSPLFWDHPLNIVYDDKNGLLFVADTKNHLVDVLTNKRKTSEHKDEFRPNLFKLNLSKKKQRKYTCYQCHDTSFVDSVSIFSGINHHPVGVQLKEGKSTHPGHEVKTDNGDVYCGSCHYPHSPGENGTFFRFSELRGNSIWCLKCHDFGDHPQPHQRAVLTKKRGKKARDDIRAAGGKIGKEGRMICETCHNTHYAKNEKLLNLSENSSQICLTCHSTKHYIKGVNHPLEVESHLGGKGCLSCHDLHFSKPDTPSLKEEVKSGQLCIGCHKEKALLIGSPHDSAGWSKSYHLKMDQKGSRSGGACLTCHAPHGAASAANLLARTAQIPGPNDVISQQCLTCHSGKNKRTVKYFRHEQPMIARVFPAKKVAIDLFGPDGRPVDEFEMASLGCTSCHDPHRGKKQEGRRVMFLRDMATVATYCSACHGQDAPLRFSMFHTDAYRKNLGESK
jgi:predicted CXXCH cytochrome family protein